MPPKKNLSRSEKNKEIEREYRNLPLYNSGGSSGMDLSENRSAYSNSEVPLKPTRRMPKFSEREKERLANEEKLRLANEEDKEKRRLANLEKLRLANEEYQMLKDARIKKIADDEVERSIFKEQKDIKEMVDDIVSGIVNKAETQGKINVTDKYNSLKEQMNKLEKGFSFLGSG